MPPPSRLGSVPSSRRPALRQALCGAGPDGLRTFTSRRGGDRERTGRELLKIHEDSYGTGAASTRVLVDGDAIVVFLDGLELQQNEELLIEGGYADSVLAQRSEFQQAIEPVFRAAVERVSGQRVVSFASITKLDPNYSVEIFRLAPQGISVKGSDDEAPDAALPPS